MVQNVDRLRGMGKGWQVCVIDKEVFGNMQLRMKLRTEYSDCYVYQPLLAFTLLCLLLPLLHSTYVSSLRNVIGIQIMRHGKSRQGPVTAGFNSGMWAGIS